MTMYRVYLGLGSNIGETRDNIENALELLESKVKILKRSSFYETEPVGFKDQPWFLNIVIKGETELNPYELLEYTQSIEKGMKRIKTIINGPRNIDVDILLYDDLKIESENLTIPHPRMQERNFVMVPLFEIEPEIVLDNKHIKDILENLKGEEIRKAKD